MERPGQFSLRRPTLLINASALQVVVSLKNNPARKGFLAKEQFDALLSHLPINLKPLVTFLYYCGVRLGEAAQIDWKQVDLPAALIRLEEDQTKNSKPVQSLCLTPWSRC